MLFLWIGGEGKRENLLCLFLMIFSGGPSFGDSRIDLVRIQAVENLGLEVGRGGRDLETVSFSPRLYSCPFLSKCSNAYISTMKVDSIWGERV